MGNTSINNHKKCHPCANQYGYNLCNQPYALCTSAKCKSVPNVPNMTICECPIKNGCSLGTQDCSSLQPFNYNNVDFIYSTFNPSQITEEGMNIYTYPNKYNTSTEFSNCLNQICVIDPKNNNTAFCLCPLSKNNNWLSFGYNYNTNPNIYLSGSTIENYKNSANFLYHCNKISIDANVF